jgi:GntR family transcriptional regulator, arabinose operon transcriptional repressor
LAKSSNPSLRYIQVRNRLFKGIESGEFQPGGQLPTEKQIMAEFDVSRGTVTKAIRELEGKGLLRRRRGAGTFVIGGGGRERRSISQEHLARFLPMVLDDEPGSYLQHQINHAIAGVCSQHGGMMSLHCVPSRSERFETRLMAVSEQILTLKPRALLYTAMELSQEQMGLNDEVVNRLSSQGIPTILIDRDLAVHPNRSKYTWIGFDNRRGSMQLTLHLLERGYRRIAFVGITQVSTAVTDRLAGYLDALRSRGIPQDDSRIFMIPNLPDDALCDQILNQARADAVICKDSRYAAMVGKVLVQRGIKLGTEMGLAGFDENPQADLLPVGMTIIRQPVMPLARAAVRVAFSSDGAALSGEHIEITTELVVRGSTCGPGQELHASNG